MECPLNETAWRRGWNDTKTIWASWPFYVLDAVVAVVLGGVFGWYWGLAIVIFGMICVWMGATARAPYKQRNEARTEIQNLVNKYKGNTKSRIIIGEPTVKTSQDAYLAYIDVLNVPLVKSPEIIARDVYATVTFCDEKGQKTLVNSIYGLWLDNIVHMELFHGEIGDIREINLKSNEIGYSLALAIKHKQDDVCYAIDYSTEKRQSDLRIPEHVLRGSKFEIYVKLNGSNIEEEIFAFILHNDGKGRGIRIDAYPEEEL